MSASVTSGIYEAKKTNARMNTKIAMPRYTHWTFFKAATESSVLSKNTYDPRTGPTTVPTWRSISTVCTVEIHPTHRIECLRKVDSNLCIARRSANRKIGVRSGLQGAQARADDERGTAEP